MASYKFRLSFRMLQRLYLCGIWPSSSSGACQVTFLTRGWLVTWIPPTGHSTSSHILSWTASQQTTRSRILHVHLLLTDLIWQIEESTCSARRHTCCRCQGPNLIGLGARQAQTSSVGAPDAEHDSFRWIPVWISPGRTTCAPALDGKHFGDGPHKEYREPYDQYDCLTDERQDLGYLRS
jgi:hypothetical protein